MTCTFGLTPCPLVILPSRNVMLSGRPKGNIMDYAPFVNIASFGMCSAPTNPEVIAATAAAMGVFTPMPCIPAIVSPWMPGKPNALVQGMPALMSTDRNMCMWLGQISFTNSGQVPIPPPVCVPPPGKFLAPIPIRMPLTDADFSGGGGGGGGGGGNSSAAGGGGGGGKRKDGSGGGDLQQQYNNDIAKAQDAGKAEEMMSKSLEKASKDYSEAGDSAKAEQLAKQAEAARNAAADKSNEAMGDVNQCYRETMPLSSSQMSQLPPEQQASYSQMREDITQKKEQEYDEADKEYDNKEYPTLTDSAAHDLKQHYADKEEQSSLQKLTSFFAESASTGHFTKPDINDDDIASFAEAASTGHFTKPDINNDDIASFAEAASTGHFAKPDIDKDDINAFTEAASTGHFDKPDIDKDDISSFAQSASTGQFSKPNVDKPSMDNTGSDAQSASTGQFSKPNVDKPSMDDTGSDVHSASTGQFSKPNADKPSMDDTGSDAQSASTGQFSKPNVDKPGMDDTGSDAQSASTGQFSKPDIDEDDIASFAESASIGQFSKPNEELHTESEQVAKQEVEIEIHKPIYDYVHGKKFNSPPTWIVVHYTACINVGAQSMCKAMKKNKDASSHFYIDEKDIYAAVPLEYVAWHVASGKVQQPKKDKEMSLKELANYKHKSWRYDLAASNHLRWQSEGDDFKGNQYSIGVDFCVKKIDTKNNKSATATDWYFEAEAVENVAKTVAYLANFYNIKLGHIIRHGDATGKLCPQPYTYPFEEGDRKWAMFKEKVANYMNRGVIAKWI